MKLVPETSRPTGVGAPDGDGSLSGPCSASGPTGARPSAVTGEEGSPSTAPSSPGPLPTVTGVRGTSGGRLGQGRFRRDGLRQGGLGQGRFGRDGLRGAGPGRARTGLAQPGRARPGRARPGRARPAGSARAGLAMRARPGWAARAGSGTAGRARRASGAGTARSAGRRAMRPGTTDRCPGDVVRDRTDKAKTAEARATVAATRNTSRMESAKLRWIIPSSPAGCPGVEVAWAIWPVSTRLVS